MDKTEKIYKLDGRQYYSLSFKKFIVGQVEKGILSKEEAKHKYKIGGNSTVLNWCRKYGSLSTHKSKYVVMKDKKSLEEAQSRRIKELEAELSDSKLRTKYLECVIEIAERELGLKIEKKSDSLPLKNAKIKHLGQK